MTTLIFLENVLGSGQLVKIIEDFGDYSVCRDLKPGENARLVVSPYKSIRVEELALAPTRPPRMANDHPLISVAPATIQRRAASS